ncbi:hypothetical protein GA707_19590 [Nostocoides sp. F2B08]|uniref:hypothetical protein n=1 Tax=Nostocoides sp. F2B08 TaxID=2653936 RepID=UPI001263D363|nr:hypothetical protein [Tetrasphaera sp. F2B08]KAB7740357.1 hypothetical protein GA707_19590 [Tetrasphaera sp. F2B08]
MQQCRRRNPCPHTWEIPLAVAVGLVLLLVAGVQVGRGLANLIAGNGWRLVDRAELFTSGPGVLAGRADAGLAGVSSPASPGLLWWCIVVVEVVVLVLSGLALRTGWGRWGPSRVEGTAYRADVDALMGIARLRRHAPLIRPDLYTSHGLASMARQGSIRGLRPASGYREET